ncbi:MAG: adenine deaminase [Oscillospiraceae bacterium]
MFELQQLLKASTQKSELDLIFKNATILNVFTEELILGDIAIKDGYIVGIGSYSGANEVDCSGKTICPGFIDSHMHIESSMVMPFEFAKAVLPSGTTTIIADPHELVNVKGKAAIEFLLDATEEIPLNVFIMLPSSVPATVYETNGSSFTANEMKPYLNHPRVLGLGEVMCFHDVVCGKDEIIKKLQLNQTAMIDGHAPNLTGKPLQAYVCAGIATDHECATFHEAYEKVQAGLKIAVREGSAAKNLDAIIEGLVKSNLPIDNFLLCTDDKHLDDIERDGHIRWSIKRAIECGLNPIKAIKMATSIPATTYGLKRIGAVAAGYKADLVLLDDLQNVIVNSVYKDGILVNDALFDSHIQKTIDPEMRNTVHLNPICMEQIKLLIDQKNHIIESVPHQILTNHLFEGLPSENGHFKPNEIYSKLCVIERHGKTNNIAVAPLKGFSIKNGAIATTVAHDSHNIIVAGDNDADIIIAVNRLIELQGGYVLVSNGEIAGELPLQVAGLISMLPGKEVQSIVTFMIEKARTMGVPDSTDPFITLSFLALPVIPQIRLTDLGLFDVEQFSLI